MTQKTRSQLSKHVLRCRQGLEREGQGSQGGCQGPRELLMGYFWDDLNLHPRDRLDSCLSFREKHPQGESVSSRNMNFEAELPLPTRGGALF